MVKNLPAKQKTWVWSLIWEDHLEKEMATHSSILATAHEVIKKSDMTERLDLIWSDLDCHPRLHCPWDFPGKNTGVGCHFLLQMIFSTQGLNLGQLLARQILYHWVTWEAPSIELLLGKPRGGEAFSKSKLWSVSETTGVSRLWSWERQTSITNV